MSVFPYKMVMGSIVVGKCCVNRLSKELWVHREVIPWKTWLAEFEIGKTRRN